jgi:hypothetical protein
MMSKKYNIWMNMVYKIENDKMYCSKNLCDHFFCQVIQWLKFPSFKTTINLLSGIKLIKAIKKK